MRRTVFFVSLLVVLGVTTTVAVAWCYAGMSQPVLAKNRLSWWTKWGWSQGNGWIVREWQGPGKRARLIKVMKEKPFSNGEPFKPPYWSAANEQATSNSGTIFEDERGWPFLSLRCAWMHEEPFSLPNEPIHGGLAIGAFEPEWLVKRQQTMMSVHPDFDYVYIDEHRALPLIPNWIGFIGSSIFYILVWAAIISAFGGITLVRRWLRRRKGKCLRCGYFLKMLTSKTCPECGLEIGAELPFISNLRLGATALLTVLMFAATVTLGVTLIRRYPAPTPLHIAAATNDAEAINRLVENGANVDTRLPNHPGVRRFQESDTTPLMWACARGNLEAAKVLLNAGATVDTSDQWGTSAVTLAAQNGHDAVLKLLLDRGAVVSKQVQIGYETLQAAASHGTRETLRLLIDAGADIDRVEGMGWPTTALGAAASTGNLENIKFLLNAGASVNPVGGNPPLMMAIRGKHEEAALLLLEHGASIDSSVGPLLWEAAEHNLTELARALIQKGADPNVEHGVAKGWTPLRRSVIRSNLELAKMLVAAGANPQTTDQNGESILFHINWDEAGSELLEYLLSIGIDINRQSDAGHTVLMKQVSFRRVEAVKRILAAGADISLKDKNGNTALDYAERQLTYSAGGVGFQSGPVDPKIVELLQKH